MSNTPQIPIIIVQISDNFLNQIMGNKFLAYVVTNPNLRADGETEEEAISELKLLSLGQMSGSFVRHMNIDLDDLVVEEIHKS